MEPTVCRGTDINPIITNTLKKKIIILWKHRPRATDLEWGTGKVFLRNYNTQTQTWTMCGRQASVGREGVVWGGCTSELHRDWIQHSPTAQNSKSSRNKGQSALSSTDGGQGTDDSQLENVILRFFPVLLLIQYVSKVGLRAIFNYGSDLETLN